MEFISSIIAIFVGIFSSLIASVFFYLLLYRTRPKIEISDKIAKTPSGKSYVIKVINKSKRDAIDIKAELLLMKSVNVSNGIIWRRKKIPLNREYLFVLNKFSNNDQETNYAFRFTTNEDIEKLWNDENQYLFFQVYAKDELSGFGKVFSKKYYRKNSAIKKGRFKLGDTFEIE